jgi:hypothetical protein
MTTTESAQAHNEAQLRHLIAGQTKEPFAPLRRVAKGKRLHSSCKASKRVYDPATMVALKGRGPEREPASAQRFKR